MADANRQTARKSLQFSTRSLLVLTAIVSLVLAFAVKLPEAFRITLLLAVPVLLIAATLQSANFATSDRWPRVALLSWLMLGAFFTLYALAIVRMCVTVGGRIYGWPLIGFCIMTGCAVTCAIRALRSYLLIRRHRDIASDARPATSTALVVPPTSVES